MCRENKFLKAAIRKIDSANSDYSVQHRHAAIIVKSGRVLSSGVNRIKTHPDAVIEAEDGEIICKSVHAEMDAILKVKNKEQLKGATIYVARKGRLDQVGMSLPCSMCQRNLVKYGFRKAVFTTEHDHGVIYFGDEE